ncbi:SDR family NAD(P)-dependent oxidoreductase [Actinocorallia lasiicapitis]
MAVVITGGTDGIGRGLAEHYLAEGREVLIVGRDEVKGRRFLDEASRDGAGPRAHFRAADLSLVAENQALIDDVTERFPALDVLVLAARFHRPSRTLTADGLESTFALFYLSRFLLSHGLADSLARGTDPVILTFGAAGHAGPARLDDLQLERGYHGVAAMAHCGALNDLLAVSFTRLHQGPVRYVTNHPGVVATSFAGDYDPSAAAHIAALKATGRSVAESVAQILPHLSPHGAGRLTAVLEGRRVPTTTPAFSPRSAERLHHATLALLP